MFKHVQEQNPSSRSTSAVCHVEDPYSCDEVNSASGSDDISVDFIDLSDIATMAAKNHSKTQSVCKTYKRCYI